MTTFKVSYTKVFVPGSILEGLEYVETIDNLTIGEVTRMTHWCKLAETKPVSACAGSDYTIKNVIVAKMA